jgi:hypothetical protein
MSDAANDRQQIIRTALWLAPYSDGVGFTPL